MQLQREGFVAGSFQEQPALIHIGPSGDYHAWRAVFQREGNWFQVSIHFPSGLEPIQMPPPEWMSYLNTFKIEPSE